MLQSSPGCLLVTRNTLLSWKMNEYMKRTQCLKISLLSGTTCCSKYWFHHLTMLQTCTAGRSQCTQNHSKMIHRTQQLSDTDSSPYHICISIPHTKQKTDEILSPTLLLGAVLKRPNSKTATPCCDQQHLPRITGYGESSMPWSSSTRQLWFVSRYLQQKYSDTIRRMQTSPGGTTTTGHTDHSTHYWK